MTLHASLLAEASRRDAAGWQRELVPVVAQYQDHTLLRPFKRAFCSPVSCSVLDLRKRFVLDVAPVPPGEMARLYLRRTLHEAAEGLSERSIYHKRVPYRRDALQFTDRRMPFYYWAGEQVNDTARQWAMVDIRHCFASIYLRTGLDPVYRPEGSPPLFGLGRAPFPCPDEWDAMTAWVQFHHKRPPVELPAPRNALVGTCWRERLTEWRRGVEAVDAVPNHFFAPDLRGFISDVCHGIGQESVRLFGAVSWAVDGGAVPLERAEEWCAWLSARWSLTGTIRTSGPGYIWSAISWRIGPVVTRDAGRGCARRADASDGIRHQDDKRRDWLAAVMRGLVR